MMDRRMIHQARAWVGVVAIAAALAGCTLQNPRGTERDGDATYFAQHVQPVIHRHCAFEGCHGREGMPLSLYAVDFLRLRDPTGDIDPTAPPLDERRLTDVELEHNRRILAAQTSDADPNGEDVILRLVPISEGGIPHGDVVVFDNVHDADLEVLRVFLGGTHELP